jgi:TATA-box binding protein (TBP) (component of TFIID and TFIIIB)
MNLKKELLKNYEEQIINHIENPTGRIKYKDTRKITIGTSKKDILSYRSRKKGAFYNCFVVILRIKDENIFKEIHIKVFNTGKLEIPGIQKDNLLEKSLKILVDILQNITTNREIKYIKESERTVLINSNFNCGYFIDREKLFNILRFNYGINSCYDPCSYPGIQCEFYYDKSKEYNSGKQESKKEKKMEKDTNILRISFMIFRTGSCLIVGKCNEEILLYIYNFIKDLLIKEFSNIATSIFTVKPIEKNKKIKKKIIYMENS